jgi:hypothetical protein
VLFRKSLRCIRGDLLTYLSISICRSNNYRKIIIHIVLFSFVQRFFEKSALFWRMDDLSAVPFNRILRLRERCALPIEPRRDV